MPQAIETWQDHAHAFEFLAFILNTSPTAEVVQQLRDQFDIQTDASADETVSSAILDIANYIRDHSDSSTEDLVRDLGVEWTRLFRGIGPGNGPPPPYEGVYRATDGIGTQVILAVNQEYLKHGLCVSEEQRDRPDYLGYQLDFVRFLAERAAWAEEQGNRNEVEYYRNAICKFTSEHLSLWVGEFCAKATEHVQTQFFSGFLTLIVDMLTEVSQKADKT